MPAIKIKFGLTKQRYNTLDAIRFIAFFKVFLLHLPHGNNTPVFNFLKQGGGTGVAIFFVLSGFLISDILIKQKLHLGQIQPKKFFWRRAFRIWPLYFFGVLLAYFGILLTTKLGISESQGYPPNPFFTFTFLENYRMIWEGSDPRGVPLVVFWSLCIEEHFYLLWLLIFVLTPIKSIVKVFYSLWGLGIIGRISANFFLPEYKINGGEIITSLDYFAAGGIVAASINGLVPALNIALMKWQKTLIYLFAILFLLFQHLWFVELGVFAISLTAFVYASAIWASVMKGSESISVNEHSIFSKLGLISYGLYVFHTPILLAARKVFTSVNIDYSSTFGLLLFSTSCLVLSIIAAWLSYKYFEGYFLKLREKMFK